MSAWKMVSWPQFWILKKGNIGQSDDNPSPWNLSHCTWCKMFLLTNKYILILTFIAVFEPNPWKWCFDPPFSAQKEEYLSNVRLMITLRYEMYSTGCKMFLLTNKYILIPTFITFFMPNSWKMIFWSPCSGQKMRVMVRASTDDNPFLRQVSRSK